MRPAPRLARRAVAAFAALVIVALAGVASAHAIGLSNGEYRATAEGLDATLTFARGEAATLVAGIDADGDGHVSALEVHDARPALERQVLSAVKVTAGGAACRPALTDAALTENDGLAIGARFECASSDAPREVRLALLDDLAFGHRHVARVVTNDGALHEEVLFRAHESFTVAPAPEAHAAAGGDARDRATEDGVDASSSSSARGAWAFFRMGIEHILTGYDHLVFLLGLVLLRARTRQLLGVVTAFTVAHSLSLALAVLGVVAPSPAIVEPAIALSIAYVGVENLFAKDGSKRWRVTFPFGLIHGFGFAGALREIALPRAEVPAALVSFNLGVEAGQLAILALVLPLVVLVRDRQPWFEPRGVRVLSGAVAVAGGIWFVSRVVG